MRHRLGTQPDRYAHQKARGRVWTAKDVAEVQERATRRLAAFRARLEPYPYPDAWLDTSDAASLAGPHQWEDVDVHVLTEEA